jgi:hypothetical protein
MTRKRNEITGHDEAYNIEHGQATRSATQQSTAQHSIEQQVGMETECLHGCAYNN